MSREIKVGDCVHYVDSVGKPTNALVTAVWSPVCINVVLVSDDTGKTDSYGRQIERYTSVCHKSNSPVHGNYFKHHDEELNPVVQPLEK